ncbi:hypothetical protein [Persicirhabdus sediminis]|uniref:Lipoprotein n=1 Tax=Persicirhabdus sediminis TaxID=454144 RepID=A0A8J7MF19_9BACT|nr:hypothetical protein [Persicirhabdus sediminis]MBK1791510.1 hypothetical protein [Persicirhabdus sediminis]
MNCRSLIYMGFASVLVASCATERTVTTRKVQSKDGFGDKYTTDVKMTTQEDGSVKVENGKRSQYDRNSNNKYGNNLPFGSQDYAAKDRGRSSWNGNTKYNQGKSYQGNTTSNYGNESPAFLNYQSQANAQGQTAYGSDKGYSTGSYSSRSTSTTQQKRMRTQQDAASASTQKTFAQPSITNWKDQQSGGMSISETSSMMGR